MTSISLRQVLTVAAFVVVGHGVGLGCALFRGTARPAAYGGELATCEATAKDWAEYTPCCVAVAQRYARDPGFCFTNDAGDQ